MSRKRNMPSHKSVVKAQALLLQTLNKEIQTNPEQSCWSCGFLYCSGKPVRAHLISVKHEGSDKPGNMLLLCDECHKNQPDGASLDVQLMWLRSGFTAASFEEEFKKRTTIELKDLLGCLAENYGEKELPHIVNKALKEGRRTSAGRSKGNAIANTVSVFMDRFFREIETVRFRSEQEKRVI